MKNVKEEMKEEEGEKEEVDEKEPGLKVNEISKKKKMEIQGETE